MFSYYFKLGVRSLRRNPALTALMVLTLAIGVAASVSTLTILHMMSGDPIPEKSDRLFVPHVDNGPVEGWVPSDGPNDDQLGYIDSMNFLKSGQGERRTAMYGMQRPIEPPRTDIPAFNASGIAPTRDFFAMFKVPFLHGQPWTEGDDQRGADVVVLGRETSEKLFGEASPVGKQLRIGGFPYTVVGVIDKWNPLPRYYKLIGGSRFGQGEEFIIPFANAIRHEMSHSGNMNCSANRDPGFANLLTSECTWIQFWFETRSASDRAELQSWLDNYANDQRKLGRLKRNAPNKLYNVMEWMEELKVVGNDSKLQAWLAFGFLILCLVNTIGLLLAKFSVRAAEIGVRRALGASRSDVFKQFLIETGVVGLVGGVLGLVLAFGALALIGMQSKGMATIARMDWEMLILTFIMSIAAALLAGLLPTWRACQVTPAIQLKSQ
ncbi:ABC transporter permease [Massilia sp. IC2-477]|uniref:ABC transporter permease n=1 Tax=unclassified Massilia TaxID=2609279 RepID=UPI001D105076|nr:MULTISPECIES: ABC transporter permease [unclassified Massilia]MCC2958473.1 ABC transporter permease [Massilia sp. IC2-477]MCC2974757.1 ABC transporter permease [Massilia sp. IC2-476]